jgi:hypothetical protein
MKTLIRRASRDVSTKRPRNKPFNPFFAMTTLSQIKSLMKSGDVAVTDLTAK